MHDLEIRKSLERRFFKLARRNPKQFGIVSNKINQIRRGPHRYKNLRKPLQHLKRVHVNKSFVLVFTIDDEMNGKMSGSLKVEIEPTVFRWLRENSGWSRRRS